MENLKVVSAAISSFSGEIVLEGPTWDAVHGEDAKEMAVQAAQGKISRVGINTVGAVYPVNKNGEELEYGAKEKPAAYRCKITLLGGI